MPLTDLEEWAQLHLQLAIELLNGLNVDQVWFFAALHLGLDNAMAYAAERLDKTVIVNLQLPVPLKFSYQLRNTKAALNAPRLAFLPWSQGARAPDLF